MKRFFLYLKNVNCIYIKKLNCSSCLKVLFISILLITSNALLAQWSNDPTENNIVAWGLRNPIVVSDMQNGFIVTGQTHPQNPIIYAQRMSVNGKLLWLGSNYGIRVVDSAHLQWLTENGNTPDDIHGISDGTGGCYIGYYLAQFIGYIGEIDPKEYYDIDYYIQRLDPNGNRLFGPNGLKLMLNEPDSTGRSQQLLYWCLDGEGGLYTVWHRSHGAWKIDLERDGTYLARISNTGNFVWGPKKVNSAKDIYIPFLDADLNLNLYYYPGETIPKIPDKFIKVNSNNGDIIYDKEIELGVGNYGFNSLFDYCFSDDYSAIFAFRDFRTDTLRIQKLDSNGNTLWGEYPLIVTSGLEGYLNFDVESDHNGGAYIFYLTQDDTFHLSRFSINGNKMWEKTFISKLGYNLGIKKYSKMISVAPDGNIFVLMDWMKYLTKINIDGDIMWESVVTNRDTIFSFSWYHGLQADSLGGCIVLWHEQGGEGFFGFRAQRINKNGAMGAPTSVVRYNQTPATYQQLSLSAYPNPFNQNIVISIHTLYDQLLDVNIYNIIGENVKTLLSKKVKKGENIHIWHGDDNEGHYLPTGVYILVAQSKTNIQSKKILLMK